MLGELAIQCMLRTLLVGIFVLTCACGASAESPSAVNHSPERWMTIRVYGNILYTTGAWGRKDVDETTAVATASPLTEADIEGWMKDCADHGVTAVLWQSNCGGTSTHPSPVFPLPGPPWRPHNAAWEPVWEFLGEQVRRFDTLTVAIAAAHKHGLKFAYALCLWDFVGSPFEESVFDPNLWTLSRDGEPFTGVPCYAEPEVQEITLKHLRDVLARGVDDVAISPFAHTQGGGTDQPYYYGFNPPLVEAYRERYGSDPAHESLDANAWWALYGDFYTDFLRQLHQETSQRGQRLIVGTTYDGHWGWGGSGGNQLYQYHVQGGSAPTVAPGCGIELQWQRWAQEGIVDGLILLAPPVDSVALGRAVQEQAKLPVLLWRKMNPGIPEEQWVTYRREAAQVAAEELGGYVVAAMVTVDPNIPYPDYPERLWSVIQSAVGAETETGE